TSLADDARDFRDPTLRARVQARAADALWETDKDRARVLFRRAWESAEAGDEENNRRMEEDRRAQMARRGSAVIKSPPNLRREVLRLASKRDRALGEEFLTKLDEAKNEATALAGDATTSSPDASSKRRDPMQAPPAVAQRLGLARQLLDDGDTERAIQFADPALVGVYVPALNFLDILRPKNAAAADQRFAVLLARAADDPASDANTVSLLSSYVFTPNLYIMFDAGGGANTSQWGRATPASTEIPPQLRAAFFRVAASVLLRPLPPPDQDRTTSGRAGTYMVIARLLPLFERHDPDNVTALRAQLGALAHDTPEENRTQRDTALRRGLVPEEETRDRVQNHLEQLDRAKTSAERDAIYLRAALAALAENDSRAQEFADKIEDTELRRQARAYIDFQAVREFIEKKKTDEALTLARRGELTHVQRAWALTEVARLLAKREPARAVELLEQATAETRRISAGTPERVHAAAAVATQFLVADRGRVWEALGEVAKAANAAEEFTGEDGSFTTTLQAKNFGMWVSTHSAESLDLAGIFGALAKDDFDRAVEAAKSFTGESPRAVAILAVARTAMESKDEGKRMKDE
ncbi:MAG: hypothetical protein M3430_20010, partial [Acidobacteriota bacterium]|nr:hypothetical protein [Acidobacteriota bacterium]